MNSDAVTTAVVEGLELCGIDYMVVGAFSANVYGIPRATHDADIVVVVQPGQLRQLVNHLGADFSLDPQIQIEGLTGSSRNVMTHRPSGFQIELFRLNHRDEHHIERFQRRRRIAVPELGRDAWLPSPEDVVIQKLRWKRRKDLDDVVNILAVSGSLLDWDYLTSWTRRHGTDELLQELLREIPDVPDDD